ncbi:MAG: EamA family transporter [Bacteroidota bacterium]
MKLSNNLLFVIPALIWGSTWYVIKFQLGSVDPLFSVSYRFGLGALILFFYCHLRGLPMRFSKLEHGRMALQGTLLFGFNYWLVYLSEATLTSGLVAIIFSTLIFMNIFLSALIMRTKVKREVFLGGTLGVSGTILMFYQEVRQTGLNDEVLTALLLCITGVLFASLGNITSAFNQKKKIPVVQNTAYGMLYGSLLMFLVAVVTGKTPSIDLHTPYLLSLVYLTVFGSIVAFTTYLTLIGRIGPAKAGYVIVTLPVTALVISAIFEGYAITIFSLAGMLLIIAGNLLVIRRKA